MHALFACEREIEEMGRKDSKLLKRVKFGGN